MSIQPRQIEARFEREHGVHLFDAQRHGFSNGEGDMVAVVSQPDWASFDGALNSVDPASDIVAGPELITVDDPEELMRDFHSLRGQRRTIERRTERMREFSGDNPDMIVTLSTPTFNGGSSAASSFLFFRSGRLVAQNNQQFAPAEEPEHWFALDQTRGSRTPHACVSGVVGEDFIAEASGPAHDLHGPRPIGRFAKTVIVSSGVTLSRERLLKRGVPDIGVLEGQVVSLMDRRPDVDDIIIADRIPRNPDAAASEGPINAHYTRRPE